MPQYRAQQCDSSIATIQISSKIPKGNYSRTADTLDAVCHFGANGRKSYKREARRKGPALSLLKTPAQYHLLSPPRRSRSLSLGIFLITGAFRRSPCGNTRATASLAPYTSEREERQKALSHSLLSHSAAFQSSLHSKTFIGCMLMSPPRGNQIAHRGLGY